MSDRSKKMLTLALNQHLAKKFNTNNNKRKRQGEETNNNDDEFLRDPDYKPSAATKQVKRK